MHLLWSLLFMILNTKNMTPTSSKPECTVIAQMCTIMVAISQERNCRLGEQAERTIKLKNYSTFLMRKGKESGAFQFRKKRWQREVTEFYKTMHVVGKAYRENIFYFSHNNWMQEPLMKLMGKRCRTDISPSVIKLWDLLLVDVVMVTRIDGFKRELYSHGGPVH